MHEGWQGGQSGRGHHEGAGGWMFIHAAGLWSRSDRSCLSDSFFFFFFLIPVRAYIRLRLAFFLQIREASRPKLAFASSPEREREREMRAKLGWVELTGLCITR